MNLSIHNSERELEQTPALIGQLGITQKEFRYGNILLPYCEKSIHPELPGAPLLIIYLHGMGSVGNDNFQQLRTPAEPLIKFLDKQNIKAELFFPQCSKGSQWVDVPWNSTAHTFSETPSQYMAAALALLDEKTELLKPHSRAVLGTSMGGYGAWDMACRRDFEIIGIMCGGADTALAERFKNCRICIYHGELDNAVPVCRARNMYNALQNAGCTDLYYNELKGYGHNVWDSFFFDGEALPRLFKKML